MSRAEEARETGGDLERSIIDRDCQAAAHLIDAAAQVEERDTRRIALRFLSELAAGSRCFARAVGFFQGLADGLREAGGGASIPEHGIDGAWAVAICHLSGQLDELVAMAEPSGFADPGELLDPHGLFEPDLAFMARLLERFIADSGPLPSRMCGLVAAAHASALLDLLAANAPTDAPRCEVEQVLNASIVQAEELLRRSGAFEDLRGLAALRRRVDRCAGDDAADRSPSTVALAP